MTFIEKNGFMFLPKMLFININEQIVSYLVLESLLLRIAAAEPFFLQSVTLGTFLIANAALERI
jgi:hypothetical protein